MICAARTPVASGRVALITAIGKSQMLEFMRSMTADAFDRRSFRSFWPVTSVNVTRSPSSARSCRARPSMMGSAGPTNFAPIRWARWERRSAGGANISTWSVDGFAELTGTILGSTNRAKGRTSQAAVTLREIRPRAGSIGDGLPRPRINKAHFDQRAYVDIQLGYASCISASQIFSMWEGEKPGPFLTVR